MNATDCRNEPMHINSLICSVAYPILEQACVRVRTRLKPSESPLPVTATATVAPPADDQGWHEHRPHTA